MAGSAPVRVAILYLHPLLGEGLAKLLAAEPGIAAAAIAAADQIGTASALASRPDVVIVERGGTADPSDVAGDGSGPIFLFVGIGGPAGPANRAASRHEAAGSGGGAGPAAGALSDDLERVVRAVRDLKLARMTLVSA